MAWANTITRGSSMKRGNTITCVNNMAWANTIMCLFLSCSSRRKHVFYRLCSTSKVLSILLLRSRLPTTHPASFSDFHQCHTSHSGSLLLYQSKSGVSRKGFLAPGNRKGNWQSHSGFTGRERELENAKGREGKFEARNPGNPGNHITSKVKFKI